MVRFGVNEDSACCEEAIIRVGDAGAEGGWTITPAAKETMMSEVAGPVDCVERLNGARGKWGFSGSFVVEDPAMAVFWNAREALGFVVELLAGETDCEEVCDHGLSPTLVLVVLAVQEEHKNIYDGWLVVAEWLEMGAGVGVGIESDIEDSCRDVPSSTGSIL